MHVLLLDVSNTPLEISQTLMQSRPNGYVKLKARNNELFTVVSGSN